MSQMTAPGQGTQADPGVVGQAQELVQEKAHEAKGALAGAVRDQVDARSTQAGSQLREVTEALQRTTEGLRSEGKDAPAELLERITQRTERVGEYLSTSNPDRLLGDAEHFARRNPWVVIGGGVALGLFASRLLKASSSRRFEELRTQGYSSRRPLEAAPYRAPAIGSGVADGYTADGQVGP